MIETAGGAKRTKEILKISSYYTTYPGIIFDLAVFIGNMIKN